MSRGSKPGNPTVLHPLANDWRALEKQGWLSERKPELRTALRNIARTREYDSGETLYLVGDRSNGMFGLVSGALDISIPRADGMDVTVLRADPGFWVGDLAFVSNQVRLVTVRAATSCRVVHLPQQKLVELARSMPEIVTDFYVLMYENVETILKLLGNLSVPSSEIRVALRLLMHDEKLPAGEGWIHLSQDELAELVALSVPTLQRALRKLENSGLVESGYGRVRVIDRGGLLALCGDAAREFATG